MIRAVIFDMDGVLTDSEPLICAAAMAMFREHGVQVSPEDFRPFVGTGENRYIGGVAEKHRLVLDLPAAKRRTYEIYLDMVESGLKSFPGAVNCVKACRAAGLRTAVASSADRIKIEANLRHIGLPLESWDAVVTAEDVTLTKPSPEIFLQASHKLGCQPDECVVVEDAPNGIAAAKAAGMRCIAVAQTFDSQLLTAADVIKPAISELALDDFRGEGNALRFDWVEEFAAAITVCDREGLILAMNQKAAELFADDGGKQLIGRSLLSCHPEQARVKLLDLLATGQTNVYTIEKRGVRKLIYQSAWFENGQIEGLVEISFRLPDTLPHFLREG
jgi:beta-phosphoglucomutase